MSDAKAPQEPSMEEILASIRRIISEDSDGAKPGEAAAAPAASAPAPAPMAAMPLGVPMELDHSMQLEDDILDLTQRADPLGDSAAEPEAESLFEFEQESDIDADEMHVPEVDFSEGLMSRASANAAEDAFARLSSMDESAPMMPPPIVPSSASVDNVLETLVKDALKPVLKRWLDDHLPPMVEELVRAEIQRLAQAGKRR
jgi:cell pole-organizing protein PopZ